ncbi:Zinc finger protein 532 [Larimichthys crocea]|uniref:Zinc finger protein 532 n=1 Tax=Larimichthys crocea TaxID=215358 RepID=A0A6G0I125_LARCR|nr:Zinc finger protein 532 [Larimichthys crocea]
MGDMKTPDFDDLLAAFDIPDMVDPKAAIESGHHDDHDGQLKQSSVAVTTNEDEANNPSTGHDVGVSVIVKNIRNTDTSEHGGNVSEKDGHFHCHPQPHSVGTGNGLHNGLVPAMPTAIAALSAKRASATDVGVVDSPTTQKESIQVNENPKAPEKPHEQESALEFAKRLLTRQPDSPSSVTSEK